MITFQAHHGDAKLSRMIRWMSPKYNHISIEIGGIIWEAHIDTGVTRTLRTEWGGWNTVVERIHIHSKYESDVINFLNAQVGKKYDTFGIFSFLWWFFKPKKDRWYCSELAQVALYKSLGVRSTDEDYDQKVSPYQFWRGLQLLKKNNKML